MVKQPQRVYNTDKPDSWWLGQITKYGARTLRNGENPHDYPNEVVAFETLNFGWILSKPDPITGKRRIVVRY